MKQREINFRAWHTLAKVMFQPKDLEAYSMALLRLPQDGHFELMQYTGLKDKNGKEIYEGDIVQINYVRGYALYEVTWQDFRWILDCKKSEGVSAWFEYDGVPYSECIIRSEHDDPIEVIGNIYENPEILEGKNV